MGRLARDAGRLGNPARRGLTSEPCPDLPASLSLRWSFSAGRELEEELLDPNTRPIRRIFFSSFKSWGAIKIRFRIHVPASSERVMPRPKCLSAWRRNVQHRDVADAATISAMRLGYQAHGGLRSRPGRGAEHFLWPLNDHRGTCSPPVLHSRATAAVRFR